MKRLLHLPRRSITLRLTLWFASVSTSVLLLLGFVVAPLVERHFEELDMELLGGKLELVRHALAGTRTPADLDTLPARLDEAFVGHAGLAAAVWQADGRPFYATAGADVEATFPPALRAPTADARPPHPLRWRTDDGRLFRGLAGTAATGIGGQAPLVVAVATDLAHHEHFMRSFEAALWSVVGLAALVSGLLGWAAARQGLAPLRDIARDAAGITATRLHRRLPEASIPEELAEVARTLNAMLARLEESFRRLSDFSSDLAHELRTPVSNLLTQTQVTLSKPRRAAEYQDILASNAEEFERLSKIIADMLFLAKADNDLVVPNCGRVDLRAEADGLLEFYEAVADERGIALTVAGDAQVSGDRLMLRRALANLLANAFQHTPAGGRIAIRLESDDGYDGGESHAAHATVAVDNTGETIPAEHLPRLFDRFYRADASRQRQSEGAGLGLAITRSIVRAHGGDAQVESAAGLTTFTLKLPVAATAKNKP